MSLAPVKFISMGPANIELAYIKLPTLICLKPAFSKRSLADLTAWKAMTSQQFLYQQHSRQHTRR
jgi:hypothetical protein